jgi:hypothetical protein
LLYDVKRFSFASLIKQSPQRFDQSILPVGCAIAAAVPNNDWPRHAKAGRRTGIFVLDMRILRFRTGERQRGQIGLPTQFSA